MPMLMTMTVYELDEVREELAMRTGWPRKYSRQRVDILIKQYLPTVTKIGKRYFITEAELEFIAAKIQVKKRRTIDNCQ